MNRGLVIPSLGLSGFIFLSIYEVITSLLSELGGFDDLVVSFVELFGVDGDSFVALVKSSLTDTHEVSESGNLVFLILMSISNRLMALSEDVLEHGKDSLDSRLVREVLSQSEHNLNHLGPLGFLREVSQEFLDVGLGFGDLNE